MYSDKWQQFTQKRVILTTPAPGHLTAACLLAAVLPVDDPDTIDKDTSLLTTLGDQAQTSSHDWMHLVRPAPVILAPLHGYHSTIIKKWHKLPKENRPQMLWLAYDFKEEHILKKAGLSQEALREEDRDLFWLIGPQQQENALDEVVRLIEERVNFLAEGLLPEDVVETCIENIPRIKQALNHLINRAPMGRQGMEADEGMIGWLRRRILPLTLPPAQLSEIQRRWRYPEEKDRFLFHFGLEEADALVGYHDGLHALSEDEPAAWERLIIGSSRASDEVRVDMRAAQEALQNKHPVILIGHDMGLAKDLAKALQQAHPTTKGPWTGTLPDKPSVFVRNPADEVDAYQCAHACEGAVVVDVPPMWERCLDVPVIAMRMLEELHVEMGRPGAPKAFANEPQDLSWLSEGVWDSEHLRDYLKAKLSTEANKDWADADLDMPRLPLWGHPSGMLNGELPSSATMHCQFFRMALGTHPTFKGAMKAVGLSQKNRPTKERITHKDANGEKIQGPIRRLVLVNNKWKDPWQ